MTASTFLIASARENGNSEQLARIAAEALPKDGSQTWLELRNLPLPPFQDLRHGDESYSAPEGNALTLCNATLDCDDLILVTPVYWYSTPAPLKLYLDYWSHWMRVEDLGFKDRMKGKRMWVIAASAGPAEEAEPMIQSLKLCATYLDMQWCGHVLGNGSAAGDVLEDSDAVEAARGLFETPPIDRI